MADLIFSPTLQPILDAILTNMSVVRLDVIRKQLIGAANINADELLTNVNPLIFYLNLYNVFYNSEGANRIMGYYTSAGNIIYLSPTLASAISMNFSNYIVFNNIAYNLALANAGTTLSFVGYRIVTQ
jgi:hypothetical protein